MLLFERIQLVVDKPMIHRSLEDQRELCKCYDELLQARATQKDLINQKEQQIKDYEAEQTLLLKEEMEEKTDAKGETKSVNKFTEIQIKSIILQGKKQMTIELHQLEYMFEQIDGKIKAVFNFITMVRDHLRPALMYSGE